MSSPSDPLWDLALATVRELDPLIEIDGEFLVLQQLPAADIIAQAIRDGVAIALRQMRGEGEP